VQFASQMGDASAMATEFYCTQEFALGFVVLVLAGASREEPTRSGHTMIIDRRWAVIVA